MDNTIEDYEVIDSKRVWTATTDEYVVMVRDTKYILRLHENDKGGESFIYIEGVGWEELYEGSHGEVEDMLVEAMWAGEFNI
tara:strand:- start:91 stop:336 length:246 start_codon:yes stop_codon:yes gene_type:complete